MRIPILKLKDYLLVSIQVELDDQITHELSLDEDYDVQTSLNVFTFDPAWDETERSYAEIRKEILGDEEEEAGDEDGGEDEGGEDEGPAGGEEGGKHTHTHTHTASYHMCMIVCRKLHTYVKLGM